MNKQVAFLLVGQPDDTELDCACSSNASIISLPRNKTKPYARVANPLVTALKHGYQMVLSPVSPNGPCVLSPGAVDRWAQFESVQELNEPIDYEMAQNGLLVSDHEIPILDVTESDTLTVWMHVTNACNLDCPYCYVKKSSASMDDQTGRGALDRIFSSAQKHSYRHVKLKYAGGESTLHFKLIQDLHNYAARLSEQTGIEVKEVVLSNGVRFNEEMAQWLKQNKIKLMISLDGVGKAHDRYRRSHNGQGTFERVAHTIDEILLPIGLKPDISMTITAQNAAGAADLVQWAMIDRELPLTLNFYRENKLSSSVEDLKIEEDTIIEGMLAAYQVIEDHLPTRPFLNGLLDRAQAQAHTHTCGVAKNYFVVTHTGQFAQCHMQLDQGQAFSGLSDDVVAQAAEGRLQNPHVDVKSDCQTCEFRYRCTGGCPLETFRLTRRWDVKSPHCRIYKAVLPDAFRLEGLRLLKVNNLI